MIIIVITIIIIIIIIIFIIIIIIIIIIITIITIIIIFIAIIELSYLPYEWENAWGTYDEKLGILSHKDNADKSNKCTITVSGNPFNGVKSSKGKNMDIENSDSNKAIDGTIFNLLDADV
jgi:hypothetical protein